MYDVDLRPKGPGLAELGRRFARLRLERDLTQAALATEAGVSKRTVERVEAGQSVQLASWLRLLEALGIGPRLDALLPPPVPSPIEQLERGGRRRQRASGGDEEPRATEWRWGDEA